MSSMSEPTPATVRTIRPLTSLQDPAVPIVFDIYQKSFPVIEQMLISFFWRILRDKEQGGAAQYHFEVLCEGEGESEVIAGFALYEIDPDEPEGGYLWYIAANPDLRGAGVGKMLYSHVATQVEAAGARALFFEIETYDDAFAHHGQEAADYAEWRKAWYKRQGALELKGTHYLCGVDWQPAIPMQVMVHPFDSDLNPEEALVIAHDVVDESIEQVGDLSLE